MRERKASGDGFQLLVNRRELTAMNNALNEVLHALHIEEFHTRMGVSRDEAEALLRRLGDLLR